jgi:phenylacetate-CoA ligase
VTTSRPVNNLGYAAHADYTSLQQEYPWGPDFLATYQGMSRSRLEDIQQSRFSRVLQCAWNTPFYQRLWGGQGLVPADIQGLEDLAKLPVIDKTMILADVDENPPFGSLAQRTDQPRGPAVLQTTSGTTGNPQPVIWGARGREVQNALLGRIYNWLGMGSSDIAHSVYGHGLVNGGHYVREAVVRYTDAMLLSAGTGIETRSERQIAVLHQFQATVLLGFADYLRKLADTARSQGLEPGRDIPIRMIIGHLLAGGREPLEREWGGAKAYNWYGVADTGALATEGPERDGLHIWEDANVVELLDENNQPVTSGMGDMVVTCLGKDDLAPLIRFNTHDVTRIMAGDNPAGLPFRRIEGLLGRSDNMVKLKGINVYPSALGGMLIAVAGFTGEYVCRRESVGHGERVVVMVEVLDPLLVDSHEVKRMLTDRLGVGVDVEIVNPGATAHLTGVHERQKPARLVDART